MRKILKIQGMTVTDWLRPRVKAYIKAYETIIENPKLIFLGEDPELKK